MLIVPNSYIYHYVEAKDKLDVWFAKQDYKTQDYLFHELEFIVPAADENKEVNEGWKARASHLCKSVVFLSCT